MPRNVGSDHPLRVYHIPEEPEPRFIFRLTSRRSGVRNISMLKGISKGRLPGQNSCEIQEYHRLWWNPYQSRKTNTGRPLYKNLESNICKLCKCLSRKTIYSHQFTQSFPSSMAKPPPHSVPNKSRQLPLIPSQNKQDALPKLQLSWKDCTNGPPPYAGMQLMV